MPVPTEFEIDYSCGHTETKDLSDLPAGSRRGRVKFLEEKGNCFECYKKSNKKKDAAEFKKYVKQQVKQAKIDSEELELPDLEGTDKQIDWATQIRIELIETAREHLVEEKISEGEFDSKILEPARRIGSASWWINNRESEPDELEELVNDVAETDLLSENPY